MVETDTGIKSGLSNNRLREPKSTVEILDPRAVAGWDAAVGGLQASTVFHTAAWTSVLTQTYGYDAAYFIQRRASNIEAILPVISIQSPFNGRRGVSLPFTDFCPILADDLVLRDRLFKTAVEYGKHRRWRYLELRSGKPPTTEATPSISYVEHVVELADDDTASKRLGSETRTAIRKAQASQVRVVVQHSLNAVKCFYDLHCRTRRKHGLPPQPFSFFANICKYLLQNNLGSVFTAFYGETPVAGAIFLHFNGIAVYKFGASDLRFQHVRGNNSIFWEALRLFYRHGYRVLSLGRSSIRDSGLRRFKCGWGAEEREIKYFRFDLSTSRFIKSKDRAYGWHNTIFSHLPIRLSRLVGYLLYRHIG